jgi:hypothetical protein
MILIKIALVAAAIAITLGVAQQQNWFERAGLLSSCTEVPAPFNSGGSGGQWWSCKEGALSGLPNLAADHCDSRGVRGNTELWYCATPITHPTF